MGYLLLNFEKKSERCRTLDDDFYNIPLKKQYEGLSLRYSQLKRFQYEQFLQACFPVGEECEYFISMPNFIRGGDNEKTKYLYNNIVIRAAINNASRYVLPNGLEIILIGDVSMALGEFVVKGIELIDGSIYKRGEMTIYATAACAFKNKIKFVRTSAPEYGFDHNLTTSILTRDLMLEMCRRCYTVSDPQTVLNTYYKWNDYIVFREYYLKEQGKDAIPFDTCEAITCYVVSRRDYQKDTEKYDAHILDNLDKIRKDEQVVVTKQFDNSERFPLVRVTLNKNRKEIFENTVKNKGEIPEFEQKLKRFTRADISLESTPKTGKSGETFTRKVTVDERYRLYFADIEPDYSAVEAKAAQTLEAAFAEIDERYDASLKQRLNAYMAARTDELLGADAAALAAYEKGFADSLTRDVAENKDEAIRRDYAAQVKAKEDAVKAQSSKTQRQYMEKIETIKKNKDKLKDKEVADEKDKLKDEEATNEIEKLEKELAAALAEYAAETNRQKETVSLQALYKARNNSKVRQKEASLKTTRESALRRNQSEKHREITAEQEPQIGKEKAEAKRTNDDKLAETKADMKENLTVRRYYVYFKLLADDTTDRVNDEIGKVKPQVLKYNQVAEQAKIRRQKLSLQNFFSGYVKNPFLSSYLFAPRELGETAMELPDIIFFSPRLNEKQKEAVRKAIASESIFLLQGPPGTGKTEVIAEIAAQFAKRGKRILISSETHKAIDNVFERLPKIPEIRPLRLIPSQSKKEQSLYSPERLVDNFYINISDRLVKEVDHFRHFSANKEKFGENYKELKLKYAKLEREKTRIQDMEISLERIKRDRATLTEKHDTENGRLRYLQDERDELQRGLRNIEVLNFANAEDDYIKYASEYLLGLLAKYPVLKQDIKTLPLIYKADIDRIKEEIASLSSNAEMVELEAKKENIKRQITAFHDPDTLEIINGKDSEVKALRGELIEISNEIDKKKAGNAGVEISDLSIGKIVNKAELQTDALGSFTNIVLEIKARLVDLIAEARTKIGEKVDVKTTEFNKQEAVVSDLRAQIREKDKEAQAAKDDGEYEGYKEIESGLKRKITEFFERFDIVKPYEDIAAALDIIGEEWDGLERNYAAREQENREKIPMYERILKFLRELQSDGAIEADRMAYTKKLFENANVYGLTCTSRDNFKAESMESFKKYAIEGLDVKKQGIDVVIIDEVSKSSFLDLLIPILYGKTVILVGDHRQLPPMYDLRNMRGDDFEGLDPDIIDKRKNDEYTELYEECFFKTLFESVPDRLRVTLTKQYRCHGDIMKVFNHFYGDSRGRGSLELGIPNQNDQKQHGLLIKNGLGRPVIESDKHIYFVDCGDAIDGYEKFGDSTSATNEREARVVIELARRIDESLGRRGGYEVDKTRGRDTRLSMGVICTYGDQAKLIKNKLKKNTLKNISEQHDERFIVSTVDDFQGDERDIIFVSMVRNPEPKNRTRTRAEFVKKFERINVALSRARRLLVIVGAKDFLSEAAIDLPDMNGKRALDRNAYPIYKKIIETITMYGLLLKASDVIGEDK